MNLQALVFLGFLTLRICNQQYHPLCLLCLACVLQSLVSVILGTAIPTSLSISDNANLLANYHKAVSSCQTVCLFFFFVSLHIRIYNKGV